jgi:hypothetical protein
MPEKHHDLSRCVTVNQNTARENIIFFPRPFDTKGIQPWTKAKNEEAVVF